MGALTHSRLDRAVVARYFFFLILSQLIIFTLLGVIFSASYFLAFYGLH
jgi:calcium permeable stress-gated cation channel